ncbi:MAG: hypothetical protein Q8L86_08230 [Vicinamibacterales bacterium]|nr:hypothetical protein [Vicinamibacterales bacterium]
MSGEWQRATSTSVTRVEDFGFHYRLNLFSNFTYFLDDPENGDQFEQADRRLASGATLSHRRTGVWAGRQIEHAAGVQLRHDRRSRRPTAVSSAASACVPSAAVRSSRTTACGPRPRG